MSISPKDASDSSLLKLVAAFTAQDGPACARITDRLAVSEISQILVSLQAIEHALGLILARRGYEFNRELAQQNIQHFVDEALGGKGKAS